MCGSFLGFGGYGFLLSSPLVYFVSIKGLTGPSAFFELALC